MTQNRLTQSGVLEYKTIHRVSKLFLLALWVVVVTFLVTMIPGFDRIVPQTPVTLAALFSAIATIVLISILVYLAPNAANLLRMSFDGPNPIIEHFASVLYWGIILAAILVGYRGFAGITLPILDGAVWIYDVLFLLIALPVVVIIAARLYVTLDPGADYVANTVTKSNESSGET